ncbi:peptidase [Cupriavidus sp. SK-4]|uniref:S26 family signal peptidase n=1 Tax=Cupriavidus sp. SK-4 TaxID=574750 RepID=UPI0004512B7B|nr:S26 family signal peptidase [Cupriavidus sp. SK-4]EYS92662.1 peptidase [Cupriavidus sp. SK-4]
MTAGTARHPRSRRRARIVVAGFSILGLAALAWASLASPLPRLTYNPSASMAVGWYRIDPTFNRADLQHGAVRVGRTVLVRLPIEAAALAAQRGYLPADVPLLKRVGAVAPQHICMVGRSVRIDDVLVAAALSADRMGRPLPSWQQCRRLVSGEVFLLSTTDPASFDSRYFGPVAASAVIGVAHTVWSETGR